MTVQNDGFGVKVRLHPTVRQINRAPKEIAPAADPTSRRGRLPRITQVLAMALQFQEMIDQGEISRHTDLALLGCVSRERIQPDYASHLARAGYPGGDSTAVADAGWPIPCHRRHGSENGAPAIV